MDITNKENREAIVLCLNKAIEVYKRNKFERFHDYETVVDFRENNTSVALYTTRHPGTIILPVKLKDGTGLFFVKSLNFQTSIAWEEDNSMHSIDELLDENTSFDVFENVCNFFESICVKHMF